MSDRWIKARKAMVDRQLRARGVSDRRVLDAMMRVPRHRFVPEHLIEHAYGDHALPIEAEQTISQPFVVATMLEALDLTPDDRVLEIGAGSGYAAAVLGQIAREVYTIERMDELVGAARERMEALEYDNVHVMLGDGSLGWPEHAPYDAIVVAAGSPSIPPALLEQLAEGGRMVLPVGPTPASQKLVQVIRRRGGHVERRDLGDVRFVPLIGEQGWRDPHRSPVMAPSRATTTHLAATIIAESCEPIQDIDEVDVAPLLDRVGDARLVLLGEATHGTAEFYRMRSRITRELILRRGFTGVAIEGDWPDVAVLDRLIRDQPVAKATFAPFARFPQWMWRNLQFHEILLWLREYNAQRPRDRRVSMYGLDLYSLYTSIDETLRYLERVDPQAAVAARQSYQCLTPFQPHPEDYGRAVSSGQIEGCEQQVVSQLQRLLERRIEYSAHDGDSFWDAAHNARLVANAERYYRAMYYGAVESWNLRDAHMFDTLRLLLDRREDARIVVWEHNSHVGDALATEMSVRGEHNVGQLCRQYFPGQTYHVGFGTHTGRVTAARQWGEPCQVMQIVPSLATSYERLCHDSGVTAFLLALRDPARAALRDELAPPRLERAIGVVYVPRTERRSHYYMAELPEQFDEYVWFDVTGPVIPLETRPAPGPYETAPFGL